MIAIAAIVGLAFASRYWSIDFATTMRRVIALAISCGFALYLGAVFRGPHLPRLLMHTALVMAVGSLVMVFAFPSIGVHQLDNAGLWRGLWYEKNQMGAVMVIGATAAAACLASPDPRRLLPAVALALSSGLVLATQSKTSLLCLVVGLGLIGGFWALRRGGAAFSVIAVWCAVVLAGLGIWIWDTHSVAVLEALGKDPSLTGRTDIWDSLMRKVADRPWTGYGYGAFWGRIGESPPADWVRKETGWIVPWLAGRGAGRHPDGRNGPDRRAALHGLGSARGVVGYRLPGCLPCAEPVGKHPNGAPGSALGAVPGGVDPDPAAVAGAGGRTACGEAPPGLPDRSPNRFTVSLWVPPPRLPCSMICPSRKARRRRPRRPRTMRPCPSRP